MSDYDKNSHTLDLTQRKLEAIRIQEEKKKHKFPSFLQLGITFIALIDVVLVYLAYTRITAIT